MFFFNQKTTQGLKRSVNLGWEIQGAKHPLLWEQHRAQNHITTEGSPGNLHHQWPSDLMAFPESVLAHLHTCESLSFSSTVSLSLLQIHLHGSTPPMPTRVDLPGAPSNPSVRGKRSPPCPYSICSSVVTVTFPQGWPHKFSMFPVAQVQVLENWVPSGLNSFVLLSILHEALPALSSSAV